MILNLAFDQNAETQCSSTSSALEFLQVQVKFEESFPFLELQQLLQIIKNTSSEHRDLLLPKALKVAMKMKNKFANSLSPDYEKWIIQIHNGIQELQSYRKGHLTINSKTLNNNAMNLNPHSY